VFNAASNATWFFDLGRRDGGQRLYVGGYIVLDTEGGAVWRIEYVYIQGAGVSRREVRQLLSG
jgi:hypothetical protein